jgi:flagellar biosynthesis/type III secretory pathway protein FliH
MQDQYVNLFTDFGFKKVFRKANIARFKPEERTAYESSLKYYRDLKNVIDTARDEGREEGREEGEEIGYQRGKIEARQQMHQAVIKMLDKGLNAEEVAEFFGVTEQDIRQIQEAHNASS